MQGWTYVILSSIILLLMFPFKITGIAEVIGRGLSVKIAVYLFTYNLINSSYVLQDGQIVRKSKFGAPQRFRIELGKRGAKRAKLALKPERLHLDVLLFDDENAYLATSALSVAFDVIKKRIRDDDVRFDYAVYPMCTDGNTSVYGKCVFRTSILRILASFISCTMKDVVGA